jgi:hypothetical protein
MGRCFYWKYLAPDPLQVQDELDVLDVLEAIRRACRREEGFAPEEVTDPVLVLGRTDRSDIKGSYSVHGITDEGEVAVNDTGKSGEPAGIRRDRGNGADGRETEVNGMLRTGDAGKKRRTYTDDLEPLIQPRNHAHPMQQSSPSLLYPQPIRIAPIGSHPHCPASIPPTPNPTPAPTHSIPYSIPYSYSCSYSYCTLLWQPPNNPGRRDNHHPPDNNLSPLEVIILPC